MSAAAQEAAAALAPAMAAELVEKIPVPGDDQLGTDLAATGVAAAPTQVPSSQPQTATAAAQAPEAAEPATIEEYELPDLSPKISDELQALLDEPDFEEEAALEVRDEAEEWDEDATDPEIAKKLRTLEKRNAWLESRVVAADRKKWVAENLKAYPLLARYATDEVAAITATSRRAFARQAATLNERLSKMVKPALEEISEAKKNLKAEVVQETRADYKEAWGEITTGPAAVPVEASAQKAEYEAAMKSGNLSKVVGVLMRAAGVDNK